MSELRHDPLSGLDVIVAAGRAARPVTFASLGPRRCRCRPLPVLSRVRGRDPAGAGTHRSRRTRRPRAGSVRVFPNMFPIVGDDGDGNVRGVHEVVALSPDHRSFAELDDLHATEVATMLRDRVRTHLDAGYPYAFATINHLHAAGASMVHPHAQVFALDFVPTRSRAGAGALRRRRHRPRARRRRARGPGRRPSRRGDHVVPARLDRALDVPHRPRRRRPRASTADDDVVVEVGLALRDGLAPPRPRRRRRRALQHR